MTKQKLKKEVNNFYAALGEVCPKYKNIGVATDDLCDTLVLYEVLCDIKDNMYAYEGTEKLYYQILWFMNQQKIIHKIGIVAIIIGFILMLGTAGASDRNSIPFNQIMVQLVISLGIMVLGFIIIKKVEE
jgi:hypothetical protein